MGFYDYYPVNTNGGYGAGSTQNPGAHQLRNRQVVESYINEGLNYGSSSRAAPTAAPAAQSRAAVIDQGQQGQFRGMEMDQAQRLQRIAGGQAQGPGEIAVNRQIAQGLANQQAQAQSARGSNASLGALAAARNSAQMRTTGAGMAGQAALTDRMAAEQQLTGVLGQGRGADIGLATQQAGLQQQTNLANQQAQQQTSLANLDAQLRQTGMNDQARLAYLQQLTGMDATELQARIAQEEREQKTTGSLMQGGGAILGAVAMSDRNLKTDIKDASAEVDAMLDAMTPYTYRYKDEKHGVGPRAGIMAQDLERSEAGRRLVVETPEGKGFDVNKAISAALAANARLHRRVSELEGKR